MENSVNPGPYKDLKQAYRRLYDMGEEKLLTVNGLLAKGESPAKIATMIQEEWGNFRDVKHNTLLQQLLRYRRDLLKGKVKKEYKLTAGTVNKDVENLVVEGGRLDCVKEMRKLISIQMGRIERALVNEVKSPFPMKAVDSVIELTKEMILDLQKIQFELGLDQYLGPVPQGGKVIATKVTTPDGTVVSTQVAELSEVASTAHKILNELGAPRVRVVDGTVRRVSD